MQSDALCFPLRRSPVCGLCLWPAAVVWLCVVVASPLLAGPPSGYRLLFADEFNNPSLDTIKWKKHYPWGRTHNHNAYMTDDNINIVDGALHLTAQAGRPPGAPASVKHDNTTYSIDFGSGAVHTSGTMSFFYGYAEASMRMPGAFGSWPAFWTLQPGGWPPEIDIMEFPVSNTDQKWRYWWNYHWGDDWRDHRSNGAQVWQGANLDNTYQTYSTLWTPSSLRFRFNGSTRGTVNNSTALSHLDRGNYLILNYAVGGWPGYPSNWPNGGDTKFETDWVRVWQLPPAETSVTFTNNSGSLGAWDDEANWDYGVPNLERMTVNFVDLSLRTKIVRWSGSRTVGWLYIDGSTVYSIGESGKDHECSLLMAHGQFDWARIWADTLRGASINCRLDLWSHLSLQSDGGRLSINGHIISQGRDNGGHLLLKGSSEIVFNGDVFNQRETLIEGGIDATLNARLYQHAAPAADAKLHVYGGSTLTLDGLNSNGELNGDASLGNLPLNSDALEIDDGTLVLRGETNTTRGLTIGAGGATLSVESGATVSINTSRDPSQIIVSELGGDLTLAGDGHGTLSKPLGGDGGLHKTGLGTWSLSWACTYTGPTVVWEGVLAVNNSLSNSMVTVEPAGTLSGSGSIGVASLQGVLNPGQSIGTLSALNATFDAGSQLTLEIGGPSDFDRLDVQSLLSLSPGSLVELLLVDGYTPQDGDTFDVLDWGVLSGVFSELVVPDLQNVVWDMSRFYTEGVVAVIAPGSVWTASEECWTGPDSALGTGCGGHDADQDNDGDLHDFAALQACSLPADGVVWNSCTD